MANPLLARKAFLKQENINTSAVHVKDITALDNSMGKNTGGREYYSPAEYLTIRTDLFTLSNWNPVVGGSTPSVDDMISAIIDGQ